MKTEVTVNEIELAMKEAFSLNGNSTDMKLVGVTEDKDGRIRTFYKDLEGNYWYKNKFRVNGEVLSEEEYIFGRELKKSAGRRYSK